MNVEIQPIRDSSNSINPPAIQVTGDEKEVTLKMDWMPREITISLKDLRRIVKLFKEDL